MRIKHRNVSLDSPFDPKNKPPDQYMIEEKILEKPGKLNLRKINHSYVPLAGKLGLLGQRILNDKKRARQLCEYNWEEDYQGDEHIPRAHPTKKVHKPMADKLNHID